jgi:membrane fusion protein, peptide pheromone/bacteriocin exporter
MNLIPSALSDYTLENYLVQINSQSKIIYAIIILLVVTGIAILPFIYVDVSVQARGFFQSEIGKQTIYAPFQGKIVFTTIRNGKVVNQGDTLFIIESETTKAQRDAILKKILENNSAISDLEKLTMIEDPEKQLNVENFITKRYFTEYSNMVKSYAIQFQKYLKSKFQQDRNEVLHKQEIIPDIEYENSLFASKSEEENLKQVLTHHKSIWQVDLMQRENEANSLKVELWRCDEELKNRIIKAPVSGEIIQSSDIQVGTMVGLNQQVGEISPAGQLIATCFVKPGNIGLIKLDQKIKIQVDAFNYNEWGFLDAKIIDISDDMIVENGSIAYFRIKCRPEKTFLTLKNGVKADLKKGMSFNARIILIKRSLFNLLFDKVDKWFNPYLKNNGQQ